VSVASRRLATGAGWLYGHRWLDRALDFLAVIVLARLLPPGDFGVVAMATSFVAIVEGLAAFDVDKALIRSREDERALFDTAWTLSTVRGIVAAAAMLGVAAWLDDPRLAAALAALAAGPLLNGLANPTFVTFERGLIYSRLAAVTIAAKVVSVVVTVIVAVLARSFWALIAGIVVGALVTTVLTYVARPYRPRPSLARASDIFAFSGWLSLATVTTTLSMQTDRLIVGRLLGVVDAGLYFMTSRIAALPTAELVSPLQRVLYPSFSELAPAPARLAEAVRESINVLGTLSLAAGCGFALVANDFVPLVLGDAWRQIVPLLIVLAPYLGLRATLSMALPCVLALGETRLLAMVCLGYAVVHVPVFIAGTAWFGLPGAIWSIVLAGMLYTWLNAYMLRRVIGLRSSEIITALRRPLLATAGMAGSVVGLDLALPWELFSTQGSWAMLALKVVAGGAVYSSITYAAWRMDGRPPGIERRVLQLTRQTF
jgi:lipopolysaccharide exporter